MRKENVIHCMNTVLTMGFTRESKVYQELALTLTNLEESTVKVIGMVHIPGVNDKEWKEYQKTLDTTPTSCNMTMSFRTKSEEDRMR